MTFRSGTRLRLPVLAGVFVGLVCFAILAISAWRELGSRQTDLRNAEVSVTNLATSLTQHAEDSFELADNILFELTERMETGGTGPASIFGLQAFLNLRKESLGRLRGLFAYDETGRWLATTERIDIAGLNNSDRDYFQTHRNSPDRRTLIGRPVKSRSGGQWIVTASRRFNHPDGSFAGVVLATIDVAYFSEFYSRFDIGPNGAITLLSRDGIVLARSSDVEKFVGRDVSDSPLMSTLRERPQASVYYFKSPLDGIQRLSFYRVSTVFPLVVVATKAQDDVLAAWRQEAVSRMSFVLALTILIALIGFSLVRQMLERQRIAAALVAREADFRLLAEASSDMVMRIGFDGIIRYVSPSSSGVLGWRPDQLLGTPALGGVNEADRERVERTVQALRRGEIAETRILYRNRHRERQEIWLETSLRATHQSETGDIDGVVAVSRDMTEQKDLQDKLAMLATVDGMTGLANRRHFDERLKEEWSRARRDCAALSFLLIDVDHFKRFNDRYGHQAGDECLRAVAKAVAAQAQRPADVAARFGGEEFALLLPGTDAQGCERIGEKVRAAIHALAIAHAANPPSKLVTISLGGATSWPASPGSSEPNSMIEAADRALYLAKNNGRDRFVMSGQIVPLHEARRADARAS